MMDTRNGVAKSRWWDSAHEALEQWRQAVRDMEAAIDAAQPEASTTLNEAESHARICAKLAEEHKDNVLVCVALTDAAAIIRDLMRDRLGASATGAGQAGQPTYSELLAQRDELVKALRGMLSIVDDSHGVAGYHLNGNVADWGEFEEVDAAGAALSRIKGETTLAASHLPAGWRIEAHEDEALLRQALEALKSCDGYMGQLELIVYSRDDTGPHDARAKTQSAIAALRERLRRWPGSTKGRYRAELDEKAGDE